MPKPSSLRDRHAETTREIVIDALVAQLAEGGPYEFSYFELARRAGVSVRTIYRHFPTRDDLFAAVDARVAARVNPGGTGHLPDEPDALVAFLPELFAAFDAHQDLILANLSTPLGKEVRARPRAGRVAHLARLVDAVAPSLSPEERRGMTAVVASLASATTWQRMRVDLGLDGRAAGAAVGWALSELFDAIRRREASAPPEEEHHG